MKLFELFYIIEGYREAEAEFSSVADADTVKQTINTYKILVNKNQFKGNERNIDYWRKQGWDNFYNTVTKVASKPTATQAKRSKVVGRSLNIDEDDQWLIVVPLDKDASCFHGKNTDWCTTKQDQSYYEKYFYDKEITLIYCLNKIDGSKWAIAAHPGLTKIECFDQKDNSIEPEQFKSRTGIDPVATVQRVHNNFTQEVSSSRKTYKGYMAALRELSSSHRFKKDEKTEEMLIYVKDPWLCAEYVYQCGRNSYPEVIAAIAIKYSPRLAANIENLTPKLVSRIARDKPSALFYIEDVSPEIQEYVIKQDPYNIEYLRNPAEEIQKKLLKDYPWLLNRVRNLSYESAKIAIKAEPGQIQVCYYQTPEIHKIAVTGDPHVIQFIENPDVDIQEIAINYSPKLLKSIKAPAREIQLLALKKALESGYSHSKLLDLAFDIPRRIRCPEIQWGIFGRQWARSIEHHNTTGKFLPNTDKKYIIANLETFVKDVDKFGYDDLKTSNSKKGYRLVRDFLAKISTQTKLS